MSEPAPQRRLPGTARGTTGPASRPSSQRDLVAASLLRCPRGEPAVRHGRPAPRSGLRDRPAG